MAVGVDGSIYAALIGAMGAGGTVFASWIGISDFEELPKKLFSPPAIAVYLALGAVVAATFQSATASWAPLQSLAVGAGWPAVVHGLVASRTVATKAKQAAKTQQDEINNWNEDLA